MNEKELKEKEERELSQELEGQSEPENDELEGDAEEFYEEDYIEESTQRRYLRYAAIAAGVVLLLVGGFLGYQYYQNNAQKEASLKLARIRPYYDQGYYDPALNGLGNATMRGERVVGLRSIADDYSSTETGKLAALYAANALVMMGDMNGAERYFNQASGAGAVVTKIGGLAGLASCKAQANNSAEAARLYEDAASAAEQIGEDDRYRLFAALHYEKAGNKETAIKLYKRIAASPDVSEFANEAKAGIIRLGGSL
jgi:predicted negative regulator of RcsB-dependent stress response